MIKHKIKTYININLFFILIGALGVLGSLYLMSETLLQSFSHIQLSNPLIMGLTILQAFVILIALAFLAWPLAAFFSSVRLPSVPFSLIKEPLKVLSYVPPLFWIFILWFLNPDFIFILAIGPFSKFILFYLLLSFPLIFYRIYLVFKTNGAPYRTAALTMGISAFRVELQLVSKVSLPSIITELTFLFARFISELYALFFLLFVAQISGQDIYSSTALNSVTVWALGSIVFFIAVGYTSKYYFIQ